VLNGKGIVAEVVEGKQSQFDVLADGELVFSKQREGRFPEEDEVLALLSAR
jgi:predicted Rdx family selenoprotein